MKVAFEFDPFDETGIDVPQDRRREAAEEVASYVRDSVLSFVGEGKSPVKGGHWKKSLSPDYKHEKKEFSSVLFANMEESGDMLDALETVVAGNGRVSLEIDGKEGDKADGHNNFSGKSKLPLREFIPKPKQTFRDEIWDGVRDILSEFARDSSGDSN